MTFFTSRNLPKHGVADFAIEAGHARDAYEIDNTRYGEDLLAAGRLRHGLTDRLTLETRSRAPATSSGPGPA